MDVVCIGDCGIDRYRPSGAETVGGITANLAVHARSAFEATDRIRIIAPLGDDDAAQIVRAHLGSVDIDCHFTELPGATPVQHIEIDADGERHFVGYEAGVLADYRVDEPAARLIAAADLLVTPVFAQNLDMFASVMSAESEAIRAVDFADFAERPDLGLVRSCAEQIDIAFFGLAADDHTLIDALRGIAGDSGVLVIVTLGADGSIALTGGRDRARPAMPVAQVVDTTGAGDAFAAGFLGEYVRERDVDAALREGSRLGAAAVRFAGGHDLTRV